MPAESLVDLARRACIKSHHGIVDIGEIPYEVVRPVLLKITNPDQLRQLEENSPQIIEKDREIWLSMLKRDIPDYESKPHEPSDPKNWWKVYRKLKKEAQEEMALGDERLKAALKSAQEKKGVPTTRLITNDQIPRSLIPTTRRKITRNYNTNRFGGRGASSSSSSLSVIDKIRKETRGASTTKMSRPTHELQQRASTVAKAPASFVRDIRKQNQMKLPVVPITKGPEKITNLTTRTTLKPKSAPYDLTQDREARLKALKSGGRSAYSLSSSSSPPPGHIHSSIEPNHGASPVNNLTLDFLEDENDDDELFNIKRARPTSPIRPGSPIRRLDPPKTLKRKEPPKLFMSSAPKRRSPGGLSPK